MTLGIDIGGSGIKGAPVDIETGRRRIGGNPIRRKKFMEYLHVRCPVAPAQFKNEAGIVGAALTARALIGA